MKNNNVTQTEVNTTSILVKWNNNNSESMKKAERRKAKLENDGYTLKHEFVNSVTGDCALTYIKEVKKVWIDKIDKRLTHLVDAETGRTIAQFNDRNEALEYVKKSGYELLTRFKAKFVLQTAQLQKSILMSKDNGTEQTEVKHTPLPYVYTEFKPQDRYEIYSESGSRTVIAKVDYNAPLATNAEHKANVEFIVRACNNHYQLLEALKKADNKIHELYTRLRSASFSGKVGKGKIIWDEECLFTNEIDEAIKNAEQ